MKRTVCRCRERNKKIVRFFNIINLIVTREKAHKNILFNGCPFRPGHPPPPLGIIRVKISKPT